MAKNSGSRSRNKGKRGELELAHVLQEHGFDARRGQQFAGIICGAVFIMIVACLFAGGDRR